MRWRVLVVSGLGDIYFAISLVLTVRFLAEFWPSVGESDCQVVRIRTVRLELRDAKIPACLRVRTHPHFTMSNEQIQLAPAAGSGIGKLLAEALLARPGFVELLAEVAESGLRATTPRRWDKETESWISDPDFRVQTQTLFGLIAQMEGEPIKRIIHQHLGGTGSVDPLAALQESPALREAAARMLEKAEWRTSGNKAHKKPKPAKIVDAEPTDQGPASAF